MSIIMFFVPSHDLLICVQSQLFRRYLSIVTALEIFLSMRYINLHFTYLLTYLLTYYQP